LCIKLLDYFYEYQLLVKKSILWNRANISWFLFLLFQDGRVPSAVTSLYGYQCPAAKWSISRTMLAVGTCSIFLFIPSSWGYDLRGTWGLWRHSRGQLPSYIIGMSLCQSYFKPMLKYSCFFFFYFSTYGCYDLFIFITILCCKTHNISSNATLNLYFYFF
jgi:hypothetical protein